MQISKYGIQFGSQLILIAGLKAFATRKIFIPLLLISWLNITRFLSMLMVLVLVGYFVMTVPLTMMTLKKKK